MKIPNFKDIQSNPKHYNKAYIKKNYNEFYNYVENNFKGRSFSEKVYRYFHPEEGKCKICGKDTYYDNYKKGFRQYCSPKCSNKSADKINVTKLNNLKKYGVDIPMKNDNIKNKLKQTNLERYGVENVFQNKYIKEKIKQTNLERYNGLGAASEIIKNKMKKTNLKRYGVENVSQNDDIKSKIKQTNLERYNGLGLASPILKEKIKQTNLKRYGVENVSLNKYIKEKSIDTQRNKNIQLKQSLIGYTDIGEWIMKCPYPDKCNKCKENVYIIDSQNYRNRILYKCELCTKLFPIGSKELGVSNVSKVYFNQLKQYFPDLITEYPLSRYKLDCYIPSLHIDIEFNGVYWHAKPTIYNPTDILNFYGSHKTAQEIWDHDKERKKYIESKGIKVIVIWEDELPGIIELKKFITNKYAKR